MGSLTPAYPPLIPLSIDVGVLLPVRLRSKRAASAAALFDKLFHRTFKSRMRQTKELALNSF
ncbi:hypothetical protein C1N70_19730 [Cytobacillus firmus]